MQIELRDGSFDFAKLQTHRPTRSSPTPSAQSALQRVVTPFRASVPQLRIEVDRVEGGDAACLGRPGVRDARDLSRLELCRSVQQVRPHVPGLRAGRFARSGCGREDIENLTVRNQDGDMIPLGHAGQDHADGRAVADQPLQSLSVGDRHRACRRRASAPARRSRLMEEIAARTLPPGTGYRMDGACPIRRRSSASRCISCSRWRCCSSISCSPASTKAGIAPIVGHPRRAACRSSARSLVLTALAIDNNLYTQIGLVLLIALSAKNAILIVEVAREHRVRDGMPIIEAAVEAARARFRPIVMTSFAFILGVAPLVVASGAGASARKSIGITRVQRHDRLDLPCGAVRAVVLRGGAAVRGMARRAQAPAYSTCRMRNANDAATIVLTFSRQSVTIWTQATLCYASLIHRKCRRL